MTILFRHIITEITKVFAIVIAIVTVIYITVDFFEKIDNFMAREIAADTIIRFFLFKIPFVVAQVMPVAVLIAALVVFGIMRKNNELVAVKSSGVGTMSLLKPAVVSGIGFCLLIFVLSEFIVPETMSRANFIWLQQVRGKTAAIKKRDDIWLKDRDTVLHINHYNPDRRTAHGVTLNYMNDTFKVSKRIDAETASYIGDHWRLENVMVNRFDESGAILASEFPDTLTIPIDIRPDDLVMAAKSTDEMGITELYNHIKTIEAQGYSTALYRVDLHAKFAFPFVCLLMSIIGAGIGMSGKTKSGITANVAFGIGVSFAYWIFHSLCVSLGYGGMLPPVIAAWAANLLFAGIGVLVLMTTE
ncbi:MAG: LPS export ABC transporter permease LptG [Thermodesulfobacteriota bacterium]|nr:LPS export ABC transporter permease LptG [Thermodesulfobacteriota bacterium]